MLPFASTRLSPPTQRAKLKSKVTKEEWKEYTKTVWSIANISDPDHPAAFPLELPSRLIKLFSFYGETALDPFGGTGTTGVAALSLGRKAVCYDQNEKYTTLAKSRMAKAATEQEMDRDSFASIKGDSRKMAEVGDDSVGIIISSPPYWDKADYGSGSSNIGRNQTYLQFLVEIKAVFKECFRVLAPGRKICINTANVNQHTNHGLLTFPLATDFAVILRDLGFVMVNELIWSKDKTGGRWGSANGQRPIFGSYPYPPNFLFKNVHEYVLVFAKPDKTPRKGPKVKQYEDLMK